MPGKVSFDLIAPKRGMKKGEEVLFEYGAHPSSILFAEYGFVEDGGQHGELDVGGIVNKLWEECEWKKVKEEVLRSISCWP